MIRVDVQSVVHIHADDELVVSVFPMPGGRLCAAYHGEETLAQFDELRQFDVPSGTFEELYEVDGDEVLAVVHGPAVDTYYVARRHARPRRAAAAPRTGKRRRLALTS